MSVLLLVTIGIFVSLVLCDTILWSLYCTKVNGSPDLLFMSFTCQWQSMLSLVPLQRCLILIPYLCPLLRLLLKSFNLPVMYKRAHISVLVPCKKSLWFCHYFYLCCQAVHHFSILTTSRRWNSASEATMRRRFYQNILKGTAYMVMGANKNPLANHFGCYAWHCTVEVYILTDILSSEFYAGAKLPPSATSVAR